MDKDCHLYKQNFSCSPIHHENLYPERFCILAISSCTIAYSVILKLLLRVVIVILKCNTNSCSQTIIVDMKQSNVQSVIHGHTDAHLLVLYLCCVMTSTIYLIWEIISP